MNSVSDGVSANRPYLDANCLLVGTTDNAVIKPHHRDWFLNQAILLAQMKHADQATQKQLQLAMLHGYCKVSTFSEEDAESQGFQITPILPEMCGYHRSTRNDLLTMVHDAFSQKIGLKFHEIYLIDNPLIREVFAREMPHPNLNLKCESRDKFSALVEQLLNNAIAGQFPEERVFVDLSELLTAEHVEPQNIKFIVNDLEAILLQKLTEFVKARPDFDKMVLADKLLAKLHLIALIKFENEYVLITPEFLLNVEQMADKEIQELISKNSIVNRHGPLNRYLHDMLSRTGYRINPVKAKEVWLKVKTYPEIANDVGIPVAELAKKDPVPRIFVNFKQFLDQPVVKKFKSLSKCAADMPPYLKVYPKATVRLLKGLAKYKNIEGQGIDAIFKAKGIDNLLQTSYFRIQNAMNEAILKKNSLVAFNNQIEIMHQEIQNILAIVETMYGDEEFASCVTKKLQDKRHPIIPVDFERPRVHLKASAMHGLASTIAAVEAECGHNRLQVAVLKDSYYNQNDGMLSFARTHSLSAFDEDNGTFEVPPAKPIDLFITEFHHNILEHRHVYKPVNVAAQIKALVEAQKVAEKFTVVIDTTIDYEKSDEMRQLLQDPMIQFLIKKGQLNIVFMRSAQKFDMLGLDNSYGGFTITLNRDQFFPAFNKRMDAPEDQLRNLCFQSLAHLQKNAGSTLDLFRRGIIENAHLLYSLLPKESIYYAGSKNPLQISRMEDDRLFYLDIKFPEYPKALYAFGECLRKFAEVKKLPLTMRASFGFINSSFVIIDGKKCRLSIGLESRNMIEQYGVFFHKLQDVINDVMQRSQGLDKAEIDRMLVKAMQSIDAL